MPGWGASSAGRSAVGMELELAVADVVVLDESLSLALLRGVGGGDAGGPSAATPLAGWGVGSAGPGFRARECHCCAKVAAAEACCSPKNACRSASWAVAGMYPPGCWQSSTAHGRCTRVPLGWVEPAARRAAGRLFSAAARRWPEAVAMSCSVASMCCSNCHGIGAAVCSCITRRCHACPVLVVCCHAAVASGCKRLVPARSRRT